MPTVSHSPVDIPGKEMPVVAPIKVKDDQNNNNNNGNGGNNSPVAMKKASSSPILKRMLYKIMYHKNLFRSKKPRSPVEVVNETRDLLVYLHANLDAAPSPRRDAKVEQLCVDIKELKAILYGRDESEPIQEACAQLTQEIFKDGTLRLLIVCLPSLNLEARTHATQVVANLQRQHYNSRLIASDYFENNLDILDKLITGYEDPVVALHYGQMLRECMRHQVVARYVLKSEHMEKFFEYVQLPNFDVASNVADTFKELMTRHKSTVAEFLAENYTWFFAEFNSKLLESTNYMTRRNAVKLLGDILLDRSNSGVMIRYVSSRQNMKVLMNLLRESHKSIRTYAFHVFKLFVANQNKPTDIVNILYANKSKLLRFLEDFTPEKPDETLEADKAQVISEIESLQPNAPYNTYSGELVFRTP